jgi:hypothetical protein
MGLLPLTAAALSRNLNLQRHPQSIVPRKSSDQLTVRRYAATNTKTEPPRRSRQTPIPALILVH